MHPEPADGQPHHRASHPLHGRWRLLRVAGLGGPSMLLATAAHLLAGGLLPSPGVLLVTTFLVGLIAVTVTARRCRLGVLTAVLGVEQLVLHEVFAAGSMPLPGCTTLSVDHGAAMAGCLAGTHPATPMADAGWGMLLAHAVATVATAWLLSRGENWLWRLCERAVRAATWAPTPRVRRTRPERLLPLPALAAAGRGTPAAPRGPPGAWPV